MAKFCIHCGRKLKEGEVCDCVKETNEKNNNQEISEIAKKGVKVITNFIEKPIDTAKKYLEDSNFLLSVILVFIGSFLTGVFVLLAAKEIFSLFFGSFDFGYNYFSSEIPYFRIFMTTTVLAVIFYFLEALILWLIVEKLLKKKFNYKKIFNIIGLLSIYNTIAIIISILGVYLSTYIVILLAIATTILNIATLALILKEAVKVDTNKLPYVLLGSKLATLILEYIIIVIL